MIRKIMSDQVDVKQGIQVILSRIENVYSQRLQTQSVKTSPPILVAVSKTKPVEMIMDAYSVGQRHFGENYVQELVEKGITEELLENCKQIRWHFIGRLQRNKINKVVNTPGIYMIETIDSAKLASSVNTAWGNVSIPNKEPLKVLVQVNTSNEDVKNGVDTSELISLYGHIKNSCDNLKVEGLMTIGAFGHDYSTGPNPDFECLVKCHQDVCKEFNLKPEDVHISMGMSDDFEQAIALGSTIVRVGSSIFGYRPKKSELTDTVVN